MASLLSQIGLTPDVSAALQGTNGSPSITNPFVTDSDPRVAGGGDPVLGGVLTGTASAAGFAVDMATQAELNAAIAGVSAGAVSFASIEKFANG